MKSKRETKKKQGKLNDKAEKQSTQNELREDAAPYARKNHTREIEQDDLSDEQLAELDKGIEEMERGDYVTMEEFRKVMRRWLTE